MVAEPFALAKANYANCQVPPACVFTETKNLYFEMKTGTDFIPANLSEQEAVASKAIDNHNRSKRVTR